MAQKIAGASKTWKPGQKPGWHPTGRVSKNVVDQRPSQKTADATKWRKYSEQIMKPQVVPVSEHLMQPELKGPLFSGNSGSSWHGDFDKGHNWEGTYSYHPSKYELVTKGFGIPSAPTKMDVLGALAPTTTVEAFDAGYPEEVQSAQGLQAMATGQRSRMPGWREDFRLQQMQDISLDPMRRYKDLMMGLKQ